MRYEDRLADPVNTLTRALRIAKIDTEPDDVEKASQATAFARLRTMEEVSGFAERPLVATRPFFAEGSAGAWRDVLNKRQTARIEADHGEMMERLGYS